MFEILLTDDPANWPWIAFFNLPSLTFSLIVSRFQTAQRLPAFIPILFAWPVSSPVGARSRLLDEYWTNPINARKLSLTSIPSATMWPPSPAVFTLLVVPLTRIIYQHCFTRLQYWTLGARPATAGATGGFMWQINEGFFIRIRANVVNNEDEAGQAHQHGQGQQQQQPQPAPAGAEGGDQEPNAAAVAAAEQLISFDASSVGRKIGGALLIPAISSWMGSLLFRLSKRSQLLRQFLAVRPPLNGLLPPPLGPYSYGRNWRELSFVRQLGLSIRLVMHMTWNGTRTWAEADPVWCVSFLRLPSRHGVDTGDDVYRWRNSVGLGLFIAVSLNLWITFERSILNVHNVSND